MGMKTSTRIGCLFVVSVIPLVGCGLKEPVQLHIQSSSSVSKEVSEPGLESPITMFNLVQL